MQTVTAKQRQQIITWHSMGFTAEEIHAQMPTVPIEIIKIITKNK